MIRPIHHTEALALMPDLEQLHVLTVADWESWLEEHHAASPGVWLHLIKKGSALSAPTYEEALQVALCFGWIDGQAKALDADFSLQRFTPRRKRSVWSQRNRDRIQALTDAGRMRPAGLAEVERAKADGRWDAAYAPASEAEIPHDLQAAIDANPAAAAFFATIDRQNRFALIYRTTTAKKPETRARRIAQFVEMLAGGETIYPMRKRSGRDDKQT
jgi:uncharacterized protein YdeI (YjbR/CyaY-like superfamily)